MKNEDRQFKKEEKEERRKWDHLDDWISQVLSFFAIFYNRVVLFIPLKRFRAVFCLPEKIGFSMIAKNWPSA